MKSQKYATLPIKILFIQVTNLLCIKENLIFDMKNVLFWFKTNSLKANAGKVQFMILNRKNHRRQRMVIISITVKESNEVILLGITIDYKLVFKKHIESLCRTAQYKLYVNLCRTAQYKLRGLTYI